jgi:DNA-binding NtrC family response regulator
MKKEVLIIEDESIIAEMMSILLEVDGHRVISLADVFLAKIG